MTDLRNSIRAAEEAADDMRTFAVIYEHAVYHTVSNRDRLPDAELVSQLCCHLASRTTAAISDVMAQFEVHERSLGNQFQ